jgi:hypothetical protein
MIQFNLLPDVKLNYVRAQRAKHTVVSAALIAVGATFLVFILLFVTVNVVQTKTIKDLTADIKGINREIENTTDLDKILTIQSQLGSLSTMHEEKPAVPRTFTFISQLVPPSVTLTSFEADYVNHTIRFEGETTSLELINKLIDTLKFTTYSTSKDKGQKAFSDVAMAQYSRTNTAATYTVTAIFDPKIFNNTDVATLTVPNQISTVSVVEQPTNIFRKPTVNQGTQ